MAALAPQPAGLRRVPQCFSLPQGVALAGDAVLKVPAGATAVLGRGLQAGEQPRPAQPSAEQPTDEAPVTVIATTCGTVSTTLVDCPDPEADDSVTAARIRAPQYDVVTLGARRYAPRRGDHVVGVVTRAAPASYTVHIGAAHPAVLEGTAFDGASKSNRPRLAVGDLVYAHVKDAEPSIDTELTCCAYGDMPRKDWGSGEAVFGALTMEGAASLTVPLYFAADLIANRSTVMLLLGSRVGFEAAIGVNGRLWIRVGAGVAKKVLVAITRVVLESVDAVGQDEIIAIVDRYFPPVAAAAEEPSVVAATSTTPLQDMSNPVAAL